jgi:hypothetical protein
VGGVAYITRSQLDNLYIKFKDQPVIELRDLISAIERESHVEVRKGNAISANMAKSIFYDDDVVRQLKESEAEGGDITSYDGYFKYKNEVMNEPK